MVVKNLSLQEAALSGFNIMVELTHADLTAAGTSQTIALLNVAPGDVVVRCASKLVTPLKDTADAALNSTTVKIGDGGDDDRFLVSQELNENGTEIDFKAGPPTTQYYAYTDADTIDADFGCTALKTLLQLDTGKVQFFFKIVALNAMVPAID